MPKVKNKRKSKKLNEKKSAGGKNKKTQAQKEPAVFENMPIVFSWSTVDFLKKPLTEFYFIAAAVAAMAMIVWGLYNRNFVMVATFVTMVIVIILVLNEEPRKVEVKISEQGIDINNEHYNYSEFRSFKISLIDELPVLILKQRKSFSLIKTIHTENEPVNDLESFLGIYLEKEE
ncbi:hypothetical protein KJ854_03320 [Patescibacteria group bacterium]|nr:hypothetical protein [Patescibacteria group bacterium]